MATGVGVLAMAETSMSNGCIDLKARLKQFQHSTNIRSTKVEQMLGKC